MEMEEVSCLCTGWRFVGLTVNSLASCEVFRIIKKAAKEWKSQTKSRHRNNPESHIRLWKIAWLNGSCQRKKKTGSVFSFLEKVTSRIDNNTAECAWLLFSLRVNTEGAPGEPFYDFSATDISVLNNTMDIQILVWPRAFNHKISPRQSV